MAMRRTPVSAEGPRRLDLTAETCTKRAGPVQTASVNAVAAVPSPASSSGASSHRPHAAPSRLVRRRMAVAPLAGTSQVTPTMENRMPALRLTGAPESRVEGPATVRRPSPGGVSVCRRTDGVRTQVAAALARGATQATMSSAASATQVVASARARRECRAVSVRVMWTPVSRCRCSSAPATHAAGDVLARRGSRPCFNGVGAAPRSLE